MSLAQYRELALDSGKESAVFGVIALPLAYLLWLWIRTSFADSFAFVLLLEACALMLAGGGMEFASSESVRKVLPLLTGVQLKAASSKRRVSRAAVYTSTGVILFVASLIVAFTITA